MTGDRDKALWLAWDGAGLEWIDALDLPPPINRRAEVARRAILAEAATEAFGPDRRISYSRRREHYTRHADPLYTYVSVVRSVDQLAGAGLLDNVIASKGNGPTGWQSAFRLSPEAIGRIAELAGDSLDAVPMRPRSELVYRDASGLPIHIRETERTRRERKRVAAINEMLAALDLRICAEGTVSRGAFLIGQDGYLLNTAARQCFRVYRRGDRWGWERGGRHYGPWWQNARKRDRRTITIDGEPTAEPDFPNLHPGMLYRLQGAKMDGDAYDIPGLEDIEANPDKRRKLVKIALNTALNAATVQAARMALAERIERQDGHKAAARVLEAISERHRPIASYFNSDVGARLQFFDSTIASRVVRTAAKRGIPTLPVHDSFICPARHESAVREVMDRELETIIRSMTA